MGVITRTQLGIFISYSTGQALMPHSVVLCLCEIIFGKIRKLPRLIYKEVNAIGNWCSREERINPKVPNTPTGYRFPGSPSGNFD